MSVTEKEKLLSLSLTSLMLSSLSTLHQHQTLVGEKKHKEPELTNHSSCSQLRCSRKKDYSIRTSALQLRHNPSTYIYKSSFSLQKPNTPYFTLYPVNCSLERDSYGCHCDLNPSLPTQFAPLLLKSCACVVKTTCIVSPGAILLRSFCNAVFKFSSIMSARRKKQKLFQYTTFCVSHFRNFRNELTTQVAFYV